MFSVRRVSHATVVVVAAAEKTFLFKDMKTKHILRRIMVRPARPVDPFSVPNEWMVAIVPSG